MESGAKGCEVVVSGKLRAARAKSMKFVGGYMIHAGNPTEYYIAESVRHVLLRQGNFKQKLNWKRAFVTSLRALNPPKQMTNSFLNISIQSSLGVLGLKVKIMMNWDPLGKNGPSKPLPDNVIISEPKEIDMLSILPITTIAAWKWK